MEKLKKLISNFEGVMIGRVEDYKNMEVAFEVDNTKYPCHTKTYRIPVAFSP